MNENRLTPTARLVLVLNALYMTADALCTVFVGVYLWINSLAFSVVCGHYIALYAVTPVFFLLAGWYSKSRDRVHVFRLGLILHAVYYGLILWLQESATTYAVHLGALLGVTWGLFWAGNNVFHYDVTKGEKREYYFGALNVVWGSARLLAPVIGGLLIEFAPHQAAGYHLIFALAMALYLAAFVMSYRIPADRQPRPFRIGRALWPGKDQRDWRLVMIASATIAGAFSIFYFLLGLAMFMVTNKEFDVGWYTGLQALVSMATGYVIGRLIVPRTRRHAMIWAVILLSAGGLVMLYAINVYTLVIFGFLRAIATPLFQIPHSGLRFEIIDACIQDPSERIEYIAAWEVPLAVGRVVMMGIILGLYQWQGLWGLQIALFLMCANRILTYALLRQTSIMKQAVAR
ncbi:MAG: MFS transporter [Candidatus Hydrogenedentes bacterium]|nr:MFS transporter [Candidatus Hydrogenedentota bacterium]